MNPLETVQIGTTRLSVTRLGLGGAPIGGLFTAVGETDAMETLQTAYQGGVRYFDTAPLYGSGKSEGRVGSFLSTVPRDSFVLSTKVGRLLEPSGAPPEDEAFVNLPQVEVTYNYTRDGILRSIEESLERLGLDRIDIALIHDPDNHYAQALGEAFPTLAGLRDQGVIAAVGAGMNQWEMLADFAREGDFDCFLLAGRYTLLDTSALPELLPLCEEKSISVILGGPYNSGILASDLGPNTTYFYTATPAEVIERAKRIKAICDRHGTDLKAAALQFGLMHPAVAATIPGARNASEVAGNIRMASFDVPAVLWDELKAEGLIPENAPLS